MLIRGLVIRILSTLATLLGVIVISFSFLYLIPGDPAVVAAGPNASIETIEQIRIDLGLNKPIYEQFLAFFYNLLHGDLGISILSRRPLVSDLLSRLYNTLQLAMIATLIALVGGITLGVVAAIKRGSFFDTITSVMATIGVCTPSFFWGWFFFTFFPLTLDGFPPWG